jgi:Spy/CpxP family protein refolding chaperone
MVSAREETTMKKTMGVIAGLGILALAGSLAYAQGPGFGWGPGYGRGPGWAPGWRTASLTAEEQAKADKLRQEYWAEMSALREKLAAKRTELLAARRAGDQAKVDAVSKELNTLYAEFGQKREEHRAEMAELIGKDVPGPGYGPGYGRGFGPGMMGRGFGPGMGRGMGMGYGPGFARGGFCPMWQ